MKNKQILFFLIILLTVFNLKTLRPQVKTVIFFTNDLR